MNQVVIDDRLPCDDNGEPIFATSEVPNEIWVMLLEKAFAKAMGCYEALGDDGSELPPNESTAHALHMLTGGLAMTGKTALAGFAILKLSGATWRGL